MLPINEDLEEEFEEVFEEESEEPSLTYFLDYETNRIVKKIDGKEAIMQAIKKVLSTELYENIIYDEYGIDKETLIGKDIPYCMSELKDRIKECLLEDGRIETVDNFQFDNEGNKITCTFDVYTSYGEKIIITEEVYN